MRSDEVLLQSWREGDAACGNELFQRHFEAVRRFFVNKVDADVEELIQRVFTRCVEAKERFAGRSSFRTYLFGISHHVLLEFFREKRREARVDFAADSAADLGAGPSTVVAARREQRTLLEGLRRIPLEFQIALELYYWEALTGPQLGEVLGVPENTARSRVRRAKELLATAIATLDKSPEVLASTTADLEGWAAGIRAQLGPS